MPIVYSTEKRGFHLVDPTKEELEAIQKIALDYITLTLGKMAAMSFINSMNVEDPDLSKIDMESTVRH